jgi:hypothetical protein
MVAEESGVGQVKLAGRVVSRLGISLIELQARGMWGEPANRNLGLRAIRRAVELGAGVLEVPIPFGPAADLVREVGSSDIFVIARLTGEIRDVEILRQRLGRRPDLIVAEERLLGQMDHWGIPLGALIGPRTASVPHRPVAAVRGPSPALERTVDMCEFEGISYMGPALSILAAGKGTVALPPVSHPKDVDRVFAEAGAIRPTGEPG